MPVGHRLVNVNRNPFGLLGLRHPVERLRSLLEHFGPRWSPYEAFGKFGFSFGLLQHIPFQKTLFVEN